MEKILVITGILFVFFMVTVGIPALFIYFKGRKKQD
jgi:hypothetical protein